MLRAHAIATLLVSTICTVCSPLLAQGCATAGDTFWQRDSLPITPSGQTAVSVIQGLNEGESCGVVFEIPAGMGPQVVTQVVAPWGAAGGIGGFNALLDVEIYDGVQFTGGQVNMGTQVFSLSQNLSANMQVSSHGLNVLDTSTYNIVVGTAPPNGTPFVRRFAICFRCDFNLHPSGSCATGWQANFFTDNGQPSIFCNSVLTPSQTSIIEYFNGCGGAYMGWRDVTTATVSGIPLCGLYYQGTWVIRCCTRDAFPASYTSIGAGCAGSMAPSTLQALSMPRIGTTMNVIINNIPDNIAFWITGWSNTNSVLGPLPYSLGSFGAPGCLLRVSTESPVFLQANNNIVVTSLTIPNDPSFIGTTFFQQALCGDQAANTLGAVASEAAAAAIGQ